MDIIGRMFKRQNLFRATAALIWLVLLGISLSKTPHIQSVREYGARGDGVTDDTLAIQAALNTGDIVVFPYTSRGYKISKTLNAVNSVWGFESKIFCATGADIPLLKCQNVSDITIAGLVFDGGGNPSASNPVKYPRLLELSRSANATVRQCKFRNCLWMGILAENCNNVTITKNDFYNLAFGVEFLVTDPRKAFVFNNPWFIGNRVKKMSNIGVNYQGYTKQTVGAEVAGGFFYNVKVVDNIVTDCYIAGIELYSMCRGGLVRGNKVSACGRGASFGNSNSHGGITIKHSQNIIVTENECTNNYNGIEVIGKNSDGTKGDGLTPMNLRVLDNKCLNNFDCGIILFRQMSVITLANNRCTGNGTGIEINSSGYQATETVSLVKIVDNDCSSNRQGINLGAGCKKIELKANLISRDRGDNR